MKSGLILLLFVVIVVAGANDNNDSTGVKCKTENCPKTRFPSTKTTNLISITNEAEKISKNFTQLKNDASAVTEKINRVSKMLESGKSDVQVRVFVSGLTAKSKSASSLKNILDGIKLNIQQVKKIANLVNQHKNSIANDDHSKLIRFSANLNKHIKDIEKIQKLLEPATFKLSSVAVNTKHARFQFGEPIQTIKNIFESLNELLSKILADFADFVRNFGLGTSGLIDKDPTPSVIECPSGGYLYSFPGSYGRSLTCHADEMEVLNVISNKSGTRINLQVDGEQFCTVTEDSYDPEDPEDPLNIIQCRHAKSTKQSAFERIKNVDGTVSFKCSNGKYLSNPKGRDLSCMANKVTETEKFKVKQPPKDNVSREPTFAVIKCHNGGFLNSDTGFDRILTCDKDNKENFDFTPVKQNNVFPIKGHKVNFHNSEKQLCGATELYDVIKCYPQETRKQSKYMKLENRDGTTSFKCQNGRFLSNSNDRSVDCKASKITEKEKFKVLPSEHNPTPTEPITSQIKCPDGSFLSSDGDDRALICGSTKKEEFNVIPVKRNSFLVKKGFKINLQPKGKSFCTWNLLSVNCYKEKAEDDYDYTLFAKEDNEDGTVSFKCANKKYLTAPGRNSLLSCSEMTISNKQKFKIISIPPAENE